MVGKWEKVDADRSIRFATRRRRRSEDGRERHLRVDAAVDRDGARLLDGVAEGHPPGGVHFRFTKGHAAQRQQFLEACARHFGHVVRRFRFSRSASACSRLLSPAERVMVLQKELQGLLQMPALDLVVILHRIGLIGAALRT